MGGVKLPPPPTIFFKIVLKPLYIFFRNFLTKKLCLFDNFSSKKNVAPRMRGAWQMPEHAADARQMQRKFKKREF